MKINSLKPQLLCTVSTAELSAVESFIRIDDNKIVSSNKLKICGYTFDSRPGVSAQVEVMERKFNELLRYLKRSGFSQSDLVTAYKSLVRPFFNLRHPLLTESQVKLLERLQNREITIITGNTGRPI